MSKTKFRGPYYARSTPHVVLRRYIGYTPHRNNTLIPWDGIEEPWYDTEEFDTELDSEFKQIMAYGT